MTAPDSPSIRPGDRVRVSRGDLTGMTGVVSETGDGWARVRLTCWGRVARFPAASLTLDARAATDDEAA